jgi:hypothetical protein
VAAEADIKDTPSIEVEGRVIRQEVRIGGRAVTQLGILARGVLLVLHLGCINRRRNLL